MLWSQQNCCLLQLSNTCYICRKRKGDGTQRKPCRKSCSYNFNWQCFNLIFRKSFWLLDFLLSTLGFNYKVLYTVFINENWRGLASTNLLGNCTSCRWQFSDKKIMHKGLVFVHLKFAARCHILKTFCQRCSEWPRLNSCVSVRNLKRY